jgi:hypothetical protein
MYQHRFTERLEIAASCANVFAELDDHERLSAHMMRSSWMMGGSAMQFEFDPSRGHEVGSVIRMFGKVAGVRLFVEEVVTERIHPYRKVWQTVGSPRLLVIGRYRMGFELEQMGVMTKTALFIEYDDPPPPWRFAGKLLGGSYARWCVRNMLGGAAATLTTRTALLG